MNKDVLLKLSYGLYIVGSRKDDLINGQIANSVFQLTHSPILLGMSINKENLTHQYIKESGQVSVSILSRSTPLEFIGHFGFKSGRSIDKFKDINYEVGITGVPFVLDHTTAYLEAEITDSLELGKHTLYIAQVITGQIHREDPSLTYQEYLKKGSTPDRSPTYINSKSNQPLGENKDYRCKICGYIYHPDKGEPKSDIRPGTPFQELPSNWACPICGADKFAFLII